MHSIFRKVTNYFFSPEAISLRRSIMGKCWVQSFSHCPYPVQAEFILSPIFFMIFSKSASVKGGVSSTTRQAISACLRAVKAFSTTYICGQDIKNRKVASVGVSPSKAKKESYFFMSGYGSSE